MRFVMRSRRVSLARTLILVEITRIARACPGVTEEEETESVQRYFRSSVDSANQEYGHEGDHHLAQGLNLPAGWLRAGPCGWFRFGPG